MEDVSVVVGYEDKDVIASGSILTFGPASTVFHIKVADDHMNIAVTFADEPATPNKPNIKSEVVPPDTLRLTFVNFNSVLGGHTTKPLELGTISDRRVWFIYRVVHLQNTPTKELHYTFYLDREVTRGQN